MIQPDPADDVVDQIGLPEERRAVRAALRVCPVEQRQVIEAMYFDGLSAEATPEELVPLGTVKSRTLLGMKRLRTAIGAATMMRSHERIEELIAIRSIGGLDPQEQRSSRA